MITTVTASQTMVLRLTPPEEITADTLIERLVQILSSHQDLQDALSTELIGWGSQVIELYLEDSSEACLQVAIAKIRELQKILVNPMDRTPLRRPVIVDGRLWEEWMFTLYRRSSDLCPFDRSRLPYTSTEHRLAREMIAWLKNIETFCRRENVELPPEGDLSHSLQEAELRQLDSISLIQGFQELAGFARRRDTRLQLGVRLIEMTESFTHQQAELLVQIEQAKLEVQERYEQLKKANQAEKEALSREYEESLTKLNRQLAILEERVRKAEAETIEHKNTIINLQNSISAAQRNIQSLQNQPKKKGKSCVIS